VVGISDAALAVLARHPFPGNVRELENVIERAFIACGSGPIEVGHLPDELAATVGPLPDTVSPLARAEAETLAAVLHRHHGDRTAAARELGMHRSTLYRKLVEHGLIRRRTDPFSGLPNA
jgi:transcriptional regulator of acetoin/glycerol metabolism